MDTKRVLLGIVLAAAILPYFVGLGATSIIDSNEAFYTETPREMIAAGDYLNSTFNFEPRFNKPPLSYWVVAGSYRVFGVSLWAARLPIALGAAVIILTVFVLGRTAFSTRAGLLAALTLAATPRFLLFSRRIIIDIYSAMFFGLTLLFFVLAETEPARRRQWLVAMYAAVGVGVLTKGPVAAALPGLVILVYLALSGRLRIVGRMMLPAGFLIGAAIVLPYYWALYDRHGWEYISSFLLRENLARYAEGVGAPNRGPLFYLPVVFADLYFPWSLLLPAGLALVPWRRVWPSGGWRGAWRPVDPAEPVSREQVRFLLGLWTVLIVGFFSASRAQQDLYVLPFVAAGAPLVGGLLDGLAASALTARLARAARWSLVVASAVLVIIGGLVAWFIGGTGGPIHLAGARLTGLIIAAGAGLALVLAARRSPFAATVAVAAALVVAQWVIVLQVLPDFERYKPVPRLAQAIEQQGSPHARVGTYKVGAPSLVFYLRRHVAEMFGESQVRDFFREHPDAYCVMPDAEYEAIRSTLGVPTRVLAASPRFDAQLRDFLSRSPLPNLVVVTNRMARD